MTLKCTVAHPHHSADTLDCKTPGFFPRNEQFQQIQRGEGQRQRHRRFALNCGCWTRLELMGAAQRRNMDLLNLLLRPRMLSPLLLPLSAGIQPNAAQSVSKNGQVYI